MKSLKSQSPRMAKDYTVFIGFCLVFFLPFLHLTYKAIMAGKNLVFNFIFNILFDISYIPYGRPEDQGKGRLCNYRRIAGYEVSHKTATLLLNHFLAVNFDIL